MMATVQTDQDDPRLRVQQLLAARRRKNCADWIEANYYIPETPGRTMRLAPFQRAVLNYATRRDYQTGRFRFQTVLWSQPKKCMAPETRVLTASLNWVPVGSLNVGDQLLAFDESPRQPNPGGSGRRFRISTVTETGRAMMASRRLLLADGTTMIASLEHKWLNRVRGGENLRWMETRHLRVGDTLSRYLPTWEPPSSYDDGYVAGVLDGEGSIRHNVRELGFGQKDNELFIEACRILKAEGVPFLSRPQRGIYKGHDYTLQYTTVGGRAWTLYCLGHYRPKRLWARVKDQLDGGMGQIWSMEDVPIVAIEELLATEVVTLGTSTETFFAEGFAAHNSGKTAIGGAVTRWGAETWGPYQLLMTMGNDAKQARERSFASVRESIELTPGFNKNRQLLPDRWLLKAKTMHHIPSGSIIEAVATDAKGEAGSNPSMTCWTELWGFVHNDALKFWAEMAPSPIRPNSIRWVETYAGFEGESLLLEQLYDAVVKQGRQLTAGELAMGDPSLLDCFAEAPRESDPVPCYVNERSGIFAFWDDGDVARRMPWQQGTAGAAYYANEEATQTPTQYDRFHRNLWVSAETNFIAIELWDACIDPLPLAPGDKTPIVIGADAAVSGDCFGLVAVSRDPRSPNDSVAVRAMAKWDPPPGGKIDYGAPGGPEQTLRRWRAEYNVVQVAYDQYQLHDMATRLASETSTWWRVFSQGQDRLIADKQLFDLIVHRRIRHDGTPEMREHLVNCNAKMPKDDSTRLRLVKKSENRHIDLAVALSMASAECLRLNL